jgi:uncharacterized protein (TIGR02757 family)
MMKREVRLRAMSTVNHAQQLNDKRALFFKLLLEKYNRKSLLFSDPVQFPHRYARKEDQEVVAFLSACFAYGSVALILRALEKVLAPLGDSPAHAILEFKGKKLWPGFYHRFHKEPHLMLLIRLLSQVLQEFGTLEGFFKHYGEHGSVFGVLTGAMREFQRRCTVEMEKDPSLVSLHRGMRFFFNAPADGSSCKRMLLFLRWMVRRDEVDFGLWSGWIEPSQLVIPVDTHVGRISHYLELRQGKAEDAANWKMALEITSSLQQLNFSDPVCYDFALSRLGILDICQRRFEKSICPACPLEPVCKFAASEAIKEKKRGIVESIN